MKKTIRKMLTMGLAVATMVSAVNGFCVYAGEPLDFSKYDQNGDGDTYIEDYRIMLDKILDNEENVDKQLDVNQNGTATVEDLLLLSMEGDMCGGIPMVPVGETYWMNDAKLQIKQRDDMGVTIEVIASGMGSGYGYFDYAILYDNDKLKVDSVEWSKEFLKYYGEENEAGFSFYDNRIRDGYVALAGCYNPNCFCSVEKVAEIRFSYIKEEKETETGELHLTYHQSKYKNDRSALLDNAYKVILGDADYDGMLSLADVKMMVEYLLKIAECEEEKKTDLDINGDGELTLQDVQLALNQALKISPVQEKVKDYFQ